MTTLTAHNFDDDMEKQLRIKAKRHNCSTEEKVYRILKKALFPKDKQKNLGSRLHEQIIEITNNIKLELPIRSLPQTAPNFESTK